MASRLDRLFILLETGSSSVTRKAAANQLGQVVRLHPHELEPLLERISTYLRHSSWETRIAASQAIEAVIKQIPPWCPSGLPPIKLEFYSDLQVDEKENDGKLCFDTFDLTSIMNCSALMASTDIEQDNPVTSENDTEKVFKDQQKIINKTLGLEIIGSNIITSDDIMSSSIPSQPNLKRQLSEVVKMDTDLDKSSRETNCDRRKARQVELNNKLVRSVSLDAGYTGASNSHKKLKLTDNNEEVENDWPFKDFINTLLKDLFNTKWEIRHGAATAIREIIKHHGRGAGKASNLPSDQMENHHQAWLEDVGLRLLCVLALDHFGDFLGDQVVAPVRETCAQALGFVVKLMSEENVLNIIHVLIQLIQHTDWTTRHGGLLGLKYLLVVRKDIIEKILHLSFPFISKALMDTVDDVSAVAASALLPIVDFMIKCDEKWASDVISILWRMLAVQDDLTASCYNFMTLLAALFSLPSGKLLTNEPILHVLPRLWSFLPHNATQVRLATMKSLMTLTSTPQLSYADSIEDIKLLQDAMRHIFQRAMAEPDEEIQQIIKKVWANLIVNSSLTALLNASCPYIGLWLAMTMQSDKIPYDTSSIIQHTPTGLNKVDNETSIDIKYYIGGSEAIPADQREKNAIRARHLGAEMLGLLSCYIIKPAPNICYTNEDESPVTCYTKLLISNLESNVAMQQKMTSLVISEWCKLQKLDSLASKILAEKVTDCMNRMIYYDEMSFSITKLIQDAHDFLSSLKHYKLTTPQQLNQLVTLEHIELLTGPETGILISSQKLKPKIFEQLEDRRLSLNQAHKHISSDLNALTTSTKASLAGALTMLQCLPEKIRPIVKPLMESIKKESNEMLQRWSADHLAILMDLCVNRSSCPNTTIINNLSSFLCVDPEFTPKIGTEDRMKYQLILMHQKLLQNAEKLLMKRTGQRGSGRPPIHCDINVEIILSDKDQEQKLINNIQKRGALYALQAICSYFGEHLQSKLPRLIEIVYNSIKNIEFPVNDPNMNTLRDKDGEAQEIIKNLQVFEVVCSKMHKSFVPKLLELLPIFSKLLIHPYSAVRHISARCLAASVELNPGITMATIINDVLPLLDAADSDIKRKGAIEAVVCIVEKLQFDIVPYIVLLIIPLLGRLCDQEESVRKMSSQCFATLIQLMPLDGSVPVPPNLSDKTNLLIQSQRQFLDQLFNPNQISDFKVPIMINAKLRSYQQTGVNWLAFLNKYKLHGILCDDMGLGKTIQSLCILASDHYNKNEKHKETGGPDSIPLPSIVVCPPTLIGHWTHEVQKFIPKNILRPLQYSGLPVERQKLRVYADDYNLFIVSYDIVRKDIEFFSKIKFNYCILDECHIIKNGKTKASQAIKQLKANHRLVLSGTPIQNSVLELWSLFDFLMPGFLGTEKQFAAKYSKPILASRDAKCSSKEQETGVLAMEALHRQVLPFVLRRMKQDVLSDLPAKITQDYYCDLSPIQQQLYEDFSKTHMHKHLSETETDEKSVNNPPNKNNILQALRYLQNVCNHPKLVLTPQHPQYSNIIKQISESNSSLTDIQHAAKLPALKQLLMDCGIGLVSNNETVISQHRALIFCQLKSMLNIIENDLFKAHMPNVSYLRLDGSVPVSQRYALVNRFNVDPSIDTLIMTTQVGGLGLNLTGADTVIFVEHDWSPMRDLQAMDRAHRIGQKKVVNVYRLITRSTLEEKIMNFQKFKLKTANTVISSENSSLQTMGTDKLLDLFSLDDPSKEKKKTNSSGSSMKSVLETLPELWDTKIYDDEYDLNSFIQTLSNA